jgi:hypothetical protein
LREISCYVKKYSNAASAVPEFPLAYLPCA